MTSPSHVRLESALLPEGWARDVTIAVDTQGVIASVTVDAASAAGERVAGVTVPGMPNLHCHAFQRLMAGRAETGRAGRDFWSWRTVMHDYARRLDPESLRAAAAQLYVEMLKAGYTAVAEFHYVHHAPDGAPFENPAEMSHGILAAARQVGIGLTHLPTLYMRGGFDGSAPSADQSRFVNALDDWLKIVTTVSQDCGRDPRTRVGVAFHSLRAVPPDVLTDAVTMLEVFDPAVPKHIHVAEQAREVEECLATTGQRPVEWLLEHLPIDERWCCIHATHTTEDEVARLAQSGAVVGLCPTTEANLGDGIFSFVLFRAAGGKFGIGSDSNVSVSPTEELRCLDYGQRLRLQRRVVLAEHEDAHAGAQLWQAGLVGGAQALGQPVGCIAAGYRADLVVLDADHPSLLGRTGDAILDSWIFAAAGNPVRDVMVGGDWVVRNGRHRHEEAIAEAHRAAVSRLG